jgi:1-acyl-sn-glycerol-3-phosphate acyltransferase
MRTARAALRTVLFVSCTLGLYSLWWITHFFVPNKVYWRQVGFGFWTRSFVKISGMKMEIKGNPPKPPFFLVSNHLSYVDIAALRAAVTGVFVAKAEIQEWWLAGRIVGDMGTIFIDRTKRTDIPRAGEKILERLDAGEGVIVFPEGTSTRGDEVIAFNSSFLEFAARASVPVSYAAISYRTDEGEPTASAVVTWWDDTSFLSHLWRLFKIKGYTAIISFSDEPVTNPDRKALARELRQRVADRFIPVV